MSTLPINRDENSTIQQHEDDHNELHGSHNARAGRPVLAGTTYYSFPGTIGGGSGGDDVLANRLYYGSWVVDTTITIDRLVTCLLTDPAGVGDVHLRIGLYEADENWVPGALVVASGELTFPSGATDTTITATVNEVLPPGRYMSAIICEAALETSSEPFGAMLAWDPIRGSYLAIISAAVSYGALPDPGPAIDNLGPYTDNGHYTFVGCRISAP